MILANEWSKYINDYRELSDGLRHEISRALLDEKLAPSTVSLVYSPFSFFPPEATNVVILATEPYHLPERANGLAFGYSSKYKGPIDSAFTSIKKEVKRDLGQTVTDTTLTSWAKQGVLLWPIRGTTITGKALAHAGLGWEKETEHLLRQLSEKQTGIVFLLWGSEAQGYARFIDAAGKHLVLTTSHPAFPTNQKGFDGCGHFGDTNDWLGRKGKKEILWGS